MKIWRTLVHKRVKIGPEISPILSKFCVVLRCQAAHKSNGNQPKFARLEEVNGADTSRIRLRRIQHSYQGSIREILPARVEEETWRKSYVGLEGKLAVCL